jgi:serine/threonine protein phosphatase 1
MLPRILSALRRRKSQEAGPATPGGAGLYAIGDIHGRADLLEPLLAVIRAEASERPRTMVVALGDYVDRGPDSRGVVDQLLELAALPGIEARFLLGNHDQILLDFLGDHSLGPYWSRVGGRETLFSFGVDPPATRKHMERWRQARDAFAENLTPRRLGFFQDLGLSFTWGDYFFAHAGAQPGTPLEAQTKQDLLWIRKPFLEDEGRFEKIVVHGHTPEAEVYADQRRIGLDTGAYMTGVLTACRFEGAERRLYQSVAQPDGPPELRIATL